MQGASILWRIPASFFIDQRREQIPPGSVIAAVFEGSRTFMVEIQALTIPAKSGYSRVYSDRIDSSRVSRISAVLEKHFGLALSAHDIYVNVAGGMRLGEVGIELPLAMAVYTSITGKTLRNNVVLVGELSLAGDLRPVHHLDQRGQDREGDGVHHHGRSRDREQPQGAHRQEGTDLCFM